MRKVGLPRRPWRGRGFEVTGKIQDIEEYYESIWAKRSDIESVVTKGGDDNDFAKGRNLHPAFLFRLEDDEIINNIKKVQDDLSSFGFYDPFPKEYLHITVKVLGFINEPKVYSNDYTMDELGMIAKQASDVLSSFTRFDITLYGVNLVPLVSFLQVKDDGAFGQLNNAVLEISNVRKREHRDFPNFMPHISISRFNSLGDMGQLAKYIKERGYRDKVFGTTQVKVIELVMVHMEGEYPAFETVERYDLW